MLNWGNWILEVTTIMVPSIIVSYFVSVDYRCSRLQIRRHQAHRQTVSFGLCKSRDHCIAHGLTVNSDRNYSTTIKRPKDARSVYVTFSLIHAFNSSSYQQSTGPESKHLLHSSDAITSVSRSLKLILPYIKAFRGQVGCFAIE